MSAATFDWESSRRRELRQMVAISCLLHAVAVAVLVADAPFRSRRMVLPSVVTVDLVAAAPTPTPAPARPAPPPPAPRPAPRKIVLPARPTRAVPTPPPAVAKREPPPKPAEEDYEDLLAKLRADAGEERPDPVDRRPPPPEPEASPQPVQQAAAAAPQAATRGGAGVPAPPEVVAWVRDARIHVRRSWVLAAGFRLQDLETHVVVDLDAEGRLQGEPRITQRSGNPWYDESVVRAIEKANPLPAPPEAGEWPFVFRPEDR